MRRYLYLLSPVLVLASVSVAMAQTLLTDAPPEQKVWEIMVKAAFPLVMTAAGPFLTSFVTTWPPLAKYVLAGVSSMLLGLVAGQVPGFPLTSESAANMGVALGPAGQAMVNGWLVRKPEGAKS